MLAINKTTWFLSPGDLCITSLTGKVKSKTKQELKNNIVSFLQDGDIRRHLTIYGKHKWHLWRHKWHLTIYGYNQLTIIRAILCTFHKKGKFIFAYSWKYEVNVINNKLILNKKYILHIHHLGKWLMVSEIRTMGFLTIRSVFLSKMHWFLHLLFS